MSEDPGRRRVRRRRADAPVPKPTEPVPRPAPPKDQSRPDKAERSLRGLIGSGPTQVSVSAAMRARDAARPDEQDIAAAERDLTIVRRHYEPHDAKPKKKR
ncbi:MAG TPA: hypothetical protein VHC49_14415 [Mycobacteriales bacterium]|nr:hypothetical protein [Mycobacteriales bacterium]